MKDQPVHCRGRATALSRVFVNCSPPADTNGHQSRQASVRIAPKLTHLVTAAVVRDAGEPVSRRPGPARRVEAHGLARGQRRDPVRRAEPADLGHHRVHLARLDVGDVDVDAAAEVAQLVAERRRAEVAADAGELALVVAERGLDHQVRPPFIVLQALPQRRVRAGVAGEDPPAGGAAVDARSRPPARCARRGSTSIVLPPSRARSPTANGVSASTGCSALGRRVKSGQITPLKMCVRSAAERLGQRVHPDRRPAFGAARRRITLSASRPIDSTWSRCEWLIRMWSILRQRVERQVADAGAGVDQHVVVEQERGGPAAGGDGAGTTEDADRSWEDECSGRKRECGASGQCRANRRQPRCEARSGASRRQRRDNASRGADAGPPAPVRERAAKRRAQRPGRTASACRRARSRRRCAGCTVSPTSGMPLTLGRDAPSTWANT